MNVNLNIIKVSKHKSKIDFEEWEDDTDETQNTNPCRKCHLVLEDSEIMAAYNMAIEALKINLKAKESQQ